MTQADRKIKVLVVDDSASMRAAALAVLKADYEVVTCNDGLEALAVLCSFEPDVIFIDIVMPKLDGYEAVALIRMNEAFTDVPVLMMSSKRSVFDQARARLLGFTGAVVKPFKSEALIDAIKEHVHVPSEAAG